LHRWDVGETASLCMTKSYIRTNYYLTGRKMTLNLGRESYRYGNGGDDLPK